MANFPKKVMLHNILTGIWIRQSPVRPEKAELGIVGRKGIMEKERLKELIDRDFPHIGTVPEEALGVAARWSRRFRGSARVSMGKILTKDGLERRRRVSNKTRLP
jgi:hypothetical protein